MSLEENGRSYPAKGYAQVIQPGSEAAKQLRAYYNLPKHERPSQLKLGQRDNPNLESRDRLNDLFGPDRDQVAEENRLYEKKWS